jgi:serine/threonine protein kinase
LALFSNALRLLVMLGCWQLVLWSFCTDCCDFGCCLASTKEEMQQHVHADTQANKPLLPTASLLQLPKHSHPTRLDMLRDIASGMVFLHSRRPPIVHGDLRSPNLLLDLTIDRDRPRYHVKIADFGLARMLGPASSITVSKVRSVYCMWCTWH